VVEILREGLKWKFLHPPLLRRSPWTAQLHLSRRKREIFDEVIETLLQKGAIEQVHNVNSEGFYSILFLRQKPNGDWRPIIDLKQLNQIIVNEKFRMESARTIQQAMEKGQWACSIDLTDAYYHVPINKNFRKFLRFAIGGLVYQFKALPFGLAVAPRIFTEIMVEVAKVLRGQEVCIHQYLDDWLLKNDDPDSLTSQIVTVLELLDQLGLMINLEKSELTPSQHIEFVGVLYDLAEGRAFPPQTRVDKITARLQDFQRSSYKSAKEWMSLVGILGSVTDQVPLGRLHVRPLQFHLQEHWNLGKSPSTLIPVTEEIKYQLKWWTRSDALVIGVPLQQFAAQETIFTDASTSGWGAHWNGVEIAGKWPVSHQRHSNVLEMQAVVFALEKFGEELERKQVLVASDNTTVIAYINHQGGTRSISLMNETRKLFQVAEKFGITLRARHIPGRLNVLADRLSRENQVLPTEWAMHPEVLKQIWEIWWRPMVDLFATKENHKLSLYVSPVPDDWAMAVDALSMSWDNLLAYAYPPTGLLAAVVKKLKTHKCQMILIAPFWKDKPWFAELLKLQVTEPIPLPQREDLLKQPSKPIYHQNLRMLNLHAWNLSSSQW